MGKERIMIEVDAELMAQLRAAGVSVEAYVERILSRAAAAQEGAEERQTRQASLRAEMQAGIDEYDALIEKHGLWSDGLRQF